MKNKSTFLYVTIPGDGDPPYVGINRGNRVTTLARDITPARMCRIVSLAQEMLFNAGVDGFAPSVDKRGQISINYFEKNWRVK